ncbi:hypothetical protein IZ6_25460 [Terrihabitans soli]|uniref:DUF2188 domain-containing protein n=1 Tax=Terrihabitans soli TaxID=708113 RepID=A0A6S6QXQ1_9HYPH|nr:hypothetical protein [Terrihabitans soli]BCJ91811.1 hypothetical protein IZ6_25460 [Terrihabitans soli]
MANRYIVARNTETGRWEITAEYPESDGTVLTQKLERDYETQALAASCARFVSGIGDQVIVHTS